MSLRSTSLSADAWKPWTVEADMVADFTAWAQHSGWTVYAETAGWDVLLVRPSDGFQIGVEAKLVLNVAVLCQVISRESSYLRGVGPDCRAVLAPRPKTQNGLPDLARQLGIVIVTGGPPDRFRYAVRGAPAWRGPEFSPELPGNRRRSVDTAEELSRWGWPEMCPDRRCALPEYIPDVVGGHSAPVALTPWKIQAIKAAIILETRGWITRADFKALNIDPSRWTQFWLTSIGDKRWAPARGLPDFKAQHPVNYEQIKADLPKWGAAVPGLLAGGPA